MADRNEPNPGMSSRTNSLRCASPMKNWCGKTNPIHPATPPIIQNKPNFTGLKFQISDFASAAPPKNTKRTQSSYGHGPGAPGCPYYAKRTQSSYGHGMPCPCPARNEPNSHRPKETLIPYGYSTYSNSPLGTLEKRTQCHLNIKSKIWSIRPRRRKSSIQTPSPRPDTQLLAVDLL